MTENRDKRHGTAPDVEEREVVACSEGYQEQKSRNNRQELPIVVPRFEAPVYQPEDKPTGRYDRYSLDEGGRKNQVGSQPSTAHKIIETLDLREKKSSWKYRQKTAQT